MTRPSPWLTALSLAILALVMLPVVYLIFRAAGAGPDAWRIYLRPSVWAVFGNSITLAALVTAGSLLLGIPIAFLTVRTDLPGRRWWSVVTLLPLALPSYILAYAYIALVARRFPAVYGLPGTAFVLTLINYPFIVLMARAALQRMDRSQEEAAMNLGCSKRQVFRRVTLPQLRPSLVSGSLLVSLYTLSDFGTPALMQFNTFTRVIYTQYKALLNRNTAALTALLLVALTILILLVEMFTRGRARMHRASLTAQRPAPLLPLGRLRWPAFGFCAAVTAAGLFVPVGAIVYWTFLGLERGQPLNLPGVAILNSMLAASLAAVAGVVAAIPVTLTAVRWSGRFGSVLERAAFLGNALPGIVIALALVFFGARHAPWLYQTLPMLVFAYVVRFLPQSVGATRTSLLQLSPRMEEAALSLGRTRAAAFFLVTLPLIAPGLLAGGALVFLTTIKELPITLLLSPTGFDTLVHQVWSNVSEGLFARASPPALLLILISAFSIAVILRQERRGQYG